MFFMPAANVTTKTTTITTTAGFVVTNHWFLGSYLPLARGAYNAQASADRLLPLVVEQTSRQQDKKLGHVALSDALKQLT